MKRIALLCILFALVGCGPVEPPAPEEEVVEEEVVEEVAALELASETELIQAPAARPVTLVVETVTLEKLQGDFSKRAISEDAVLGFDPEKQVLYQDVTDPSLEGTGRVRITHLETGQTKETGLGRLYRYLDGQRVVDGKLHLIGPNLEEGTLDHLVIAPEATVELTELPPSDRGGVTAADGGFYVMLENLAAEDRVEYALLYLPYDSSDMEELYRGHYTLGADGQVAEGHALGNFHAMGDHLGFQELEGDLDNDPKVKASYLWDVKGDLLHGVGFITRPSTFLAGDPELILDLKTRETEWGSEEEPLILYRKEGTEYIPYVISGYEYANFIGEARLLEGGGLYIQGDHSLDFLDLETMVVKKIPLGGAQFDFLDFSEGNVLSFVERGEGGPLLHWGSLGEQ